jgi:hypothetical protein
MAWLLLLLLLLPLHPAACRSLEMPQHQQQLGPLLVLLAQVMQAAAWLLLQQAAWAAAWAPSLWQLLVVLWLVRLLQLM